MLYKPKRRTDALVRRSPEKWAEMINEKIEDRKVRIKVAYIVWWDFGSYHKGETKIGQRWAVFQASYAEGLIQSEVVAEETAEGLKLLGYPYPLQRMGIINRRKVQ